MNIIDMKALSYYMIDLINEEREQRGKDSLVINEELMDDAALRAEESSIKFSHTRPNGKDYSTAINVEYSKVGEKFWYILRLHRIQRWRRLHSKL